MEEKQTSIGEESNQVDLAIQPATGPSSNGLFNPERLRLSQNFADSVGIKKALLSVPVRKPDRQSFIRVHPDPDYMLDTLVLELREDRETFLVDPGLASELPGEVTAKRLYSTITRQGVVFLWHLRLPGEDGRVDEWNRVALEAADLAKEKWIRLAANMNLGAYEVFEATGDLPEPEWPDYTFQKLLEIAFKDRLIQDADHPVLRKLRGEL